ncbi:MAG TPA: LysM peptidoglycan-binding domain-containing protein [Candidatus Sulfotelmatobacter sp.]|nr:LysM peptidoglycan-binding domain-containing protein [Candidatus Sulfotelmatobacter sp.]
MERYVVKRGDTLSAIAARTHISLKALIAANRKIKNPDKILVGEFINLPIEARHPVGAVGGPSLQDIFGKGAVPTDGEPSKDPRFLEASVRAVGIPIWGGPFALYRKVENNRASDPVMLARSEVSLASDPLKQSFAEIKAAYSTRAFANDAIANFQFPNAYTYYVGDGGLLFPTVISDTTAPALCDALRKAVEQERKDAQAAEKLSRDLLFWYVGARFPPAVGGSTAETAPAAAADTALAGFTATEKAIIAEARQVMSSPEMMQIRHAQALGKPVIVKIGGRLIQYEPGFPFSGMTNFEQNGFVIGREAFTSEGELTKTVLHELYRLTTSTARGIGGGGLNNAETQAAFEFAERAFNAIFAAP